MALGILLAPAGSTQAADETGKWYVNPQAGYLWTDDDRFVDDDDYYGLGLGKHVSPEWSVELNGVTGSYDPSIAGTDVDITAFSIDALRVFRRAERVSPFVRVGAGYIDDELISGDSHGSALAQLGAGLLIDLAENSSHSFVLQLRPEVLVRWDFIDQGGTRDLLDYMAGIGLQFAFGAAPAAAAAPTVPAATAAPP
jgi:OOP family OmpA-OmpF porin